jgi:RNA polymerase sigma-70 factor (ECF subfamily)
MKRLEPSAPASDEDLIERVLSGDDEAYATIVGRYQKKIFRVTRAIVRNDMDADAVTQDTFVKAYYRLREFEGRSELETWLTRIAINRARDCLRRRKRWFRLGEPGDGDNVLSFEPADERPDAEREALSNEIGRAVDRVVSGLSDQQKTIFCLRHYENLSLEEIARILGLKSGTVRAHLFRAVHRLRDELAQWSPVPNELKGVKR